MAHRPGLAPALLVALVSFEGRLRGSASDHWPRLDTHPVDDRRTHRYSGSIGGAVGGAAGRPVPSWRVAGGSLAQGLARSWRSTPGT